MPVFTILNALLPLLAAVPSLEADLSAAFSAHWGKDHVQQAVQGVGVLAKIVNDIAASMEPTQVPPPIEPSPVLTQQAILTQAELMAQQPSAVPV